MAKHRRASKDPIAAGAPLDPGESGRIPSRLEKEPTDLSTDMYRCKWSICVLTSYSCITRDSARWVLRGGAFGSRRSGVLVAFCISAVISKLLDTVPVERAPRLCDGCSEMGRRRLALDARQIKQIHVFCSFTHVCCSCGSCDVHVFCSKRSDRNSGICCQGNALSHAKTEERHTEV